MINPETITNCDQMYHFAMVTGMREWKFMQAGQTI